MFVLLSSYAMRHFAGRNTEDVVSAQQYFDTLQDFCYLLSTSFGPKETQLGNNRIALILLLLFALPIKEGRADTVSSVLIGSSDILEIRIDTSLPESGLVGPKIQAKNLLKLMSVKVLPLIPDRLRAQIQGKKALLTFTNTCPVDGLFFDPETRPGRASSPQLEFCIHSDLVESNDLEALFVHEFFHVLHYVIHPNEMPWVREGLAQLFEFRVLDRFNSSNFKAAMAQLTTPLEGAYSLDKIDRAQYGHDLLYFYYLWSRCGGDELFWKLVEGAPAVYEGQAIDLALEALSGLQKSSQTPECSSFEASAIHFEVARAHNHIQFGAESTERYFLVPQTLMGHWSTAQPASSVQAVLGDKTELEMGRFTPLLLTADATVKAAFLREFRQFWLEKRFPYRVSQLPPAQDQLSQWNWLLIRK